jgi:hypothetical protein
MKNGANYKDRNDIARLAAQGLDAGAISAKLQIASTCVENFMPGKKVATKPAGKKAAAKATESTEPTGE